MGHNKIIGQLGIGVWGGLCSSTYPYVKFILTWEHQPYAAGLKSGHSPAEASRYNHTFFRGSNLQTSAGELPVALPANLGR